MTGSGADVAIVTGAASGIGAATARGIAASGHRVALFDRDAKGAAELASVLAQRGGSVTVHEVDVTDSDAVEAAVGDVEAAHGRIDHLVNCAGITGVRAALWEIEPADFDAVVATNLRSVWLTMRAVLPRMRARGRGSIVNVASTAGLIGYAEKAPYTAAKHGVVGLTKVAALEGRDRGIRVNCVCPGAIDTPLIRAAVAPNLAPEQADEAMAARAAAQPLGRLGTADEVAAAILFLLDDRASLVSGAVLAVDGSLLAG